MILQHSVTRSYSFEAGHWLPLVREGHKCRRPHGHNYVLAVTASGPLVKGFVIDFWDLDDIVNPLLAIVDHQMLNEIAGLDNPTAEVIAAWFYEQIETRLNEDEVELDSVTVFETPTCSAVARGAIK